jgi:hypothetical protein
MMDIRVFVIDAMQTNTKLNAYIVLGLGLLCVVSTSFYAFSCGMRRNKAK